MKPEQDHYLRDGLIIMAALIVMAGMFIAWALLDKSTPNKKYHEARIEIRA